MVHIPRYINVEVTGCIGMAATFGFHLLPRHTEISTEMIPTSPDGHRGNGEASPWKGWVGVVIPQRVRKNLFGFFPMNEAQENKGDVLPHCRVFFKLPI